MDLCPITGSDCHCNKKLAATREGSSLLIDLKGSLRFLFTDHTNLTSRLIEKQLPVLRYGADSVAKRLLRNPSDIRKLIEPIVGAGLGKDIEQLFSDHLKLAAAVLPLLRNGSANLKQSIDKFYAQGDDVAEGLTKINEIKLPYSETKKMMHLHNERVVKLATLAFAEKEDEFTKTYDAYYAHILKLADAIYIGLSTPFSSD